MKHAVRINMLDEMKFGDVSYLPIDFGAFKIKVVKRQSDYQCVLYDKNDKQLRWTCHKNLDHAFGEAVLVYMDMVATGEINNV